MSIQSMIEAVIKPVVPEIARGEYTGEGEAFCVWDAAQVPDAFGDNAAAATRYQVQLNLCVPFEDDPQTWIDRLVKAVQSEDLFGVPTVEPVEADEQDGFRQYLFDFEAIIREGI